MINKEIIIQLIAIIFFISPASAEIYKWLDKNGAPHFSDHPPVEEQTEYDEIKPESGAISRTASRKTAYLAIDLKGNEYLWPDYVDEGDKYCVPIQGGRFCILKIKIASIREVTGRRKKDFDRPPYSAIIKGSADKKRSPAEDALDDYEEEYPERTESIPEPPHNDFSLIGAGKLCRYAVLNMSIPVSTVRGGNTYYVKTAERTNILPYKDKFGRYGHRFCFKTTSFAPEVEIGLSRSILCSIYKVGDKWKYELQTDCSFMQ